MSRLFRGRIVNGWSIVHEVASLLLVLSGGFVGYIYGVYDATGFLPKYFMESKVILPPEITPVVEAKQVYEFVKADDTKLNKYDIGFNSVEYAFLLARNAHWKGLPAEVIKLGFVDKDVGHLILAFPTTDKAWVFIDPTSSLPIKPNIGVWLGDSRIQDMWILRAGWEPFRLEVME